jgi:LacI family transcriptional regulator
VITIKQIADLAGTSRGTVDRVLHNRGSVNPEIAKRILDIAEANNYRSNPFAKALVKGDKRHVVGIVLNSVGNPFFEEVLRGITEASEKYRKYGFEINIKEIKGYNEEEQLKAIRAVIAANPSALAITPMNTKGISKELSELTSIPIVTINQDIPLKNKFAFVGCDYSNSGRVSGDIAKLILPKGGNVGIVTGSFKILGHNERIQGFEEVVGTKDGVKINVVGVVENNDDDINSYTATRKLIREKKPDLIYFCAAGTEGGVKAVIEAAKDIKIVVVDDIPPMRTFLSRGSIQAIVTQHPYNQGAEMIEILYDFLVNGKKPKKVQNFTENRVMLPHSIS